MPDNPPIFDVVRFYQHLRGHTGKLGILYRTHGPDWAELSLPYSPALIGNPAIGAMIEHHAMLYDDLRDPVALLRGVECYRVTRSIAFVRGQAHDGDPADPLAHVAGTFMFLETAS